MRTRLLDLRHRYGLDEPDLVAGEMTYDRRLTLCMAPPSLEAWPLKWVSHTAHPLRPEAYTAGEEVGWLDELPRDRPIVAVSFGTLFGTKRLEEVAAEAAFDSGAKVVVVTRHELDLTDSRLHVIAWASMPALLRACAAVIHHGGWGSTVAALDAAVPAIVIPLGADQDFQGARLASVGAAIAFREGDNPSRDQIATAVESLLDDDGYRVNAARLAAEIESMPSPAEVVPLVEQLAETGGPVLNQ